MEEIISKDTGSGKEQQADSQVIPADPYGNVTRELSEEELKSPAVQKLLINEHDRMLNEINRLKQFSDKYHEKDKESAVLLEKQKISKASEVLYTFCEVGGSLLAGISSIYWDNHGWIILLTGILFVAGGIIYKLVK